MMPDFVGNHIGLGELTGLAADIASAEAPLKVLEEAGVKIDLVVDRTVERTHGLHHCGLGKPAAGPCRLGKHDQRWGFVGFPGLGKDLLPLRFCAPKNGRHELAHLIGWKACLRR